MTTVRKNKNRGYQQLRVWEDAIGFYSVTCRVFRKFPYELKRVASQAIASAAGNPNPSSIDGTTTASAPR